LKQSDALNGAREHIAWIVALALSTSAIIYLENLDMDLPRRSAPVSTELARSAAQALAAAEQRRRTNPDEMGAAVELVVAVSVAVQAGIMDPAEGQARVAVLRKETEDTPGWESVNVLADLTFAP
jgi:hypothetical protein